MYISYLIQKQTATAIQSGNFLVLYRDLGRQLVRHRKRTILFCFKVKVKVMDLYSTFQMGYTLPKALYM